VINKIDLPITGERMKKAIDIFGKNGVKVLAFSAVTGEGVQNVIYEIIEALKLKKTD
jgi:translation elongation factor EF-4